MSWITGVRKAIVAVAAMGALWASPSRAAIMILTVQGVASPTGSYAPFASSFPQFAAGQQPAPYTLQYTYNTSLSTSPITLARLTVLDGTYLLDSFGQSAVGPVGAGTRLYGALPSGGTFIQTDIIGGFGSGLAGPFALNCPQGCGSGFFQLPAGAGGLNLSVTAANSVLVPTPTPEPQAWALMIVGFGMVGAAMRRRRSQSAITA